MKTIKIISFFVLALTIMSSCKKDDKENYASPSIIWDGPSYSILNFRKSNITNLELKIKFYAEAGIKRINVIEKIYNKSVEEISSRELPSPSNYSGNTVFEYNFSREYDKSSFSDNRTIKLEFEVIDNQDRNASKVYTISTISDTQDNDKYYVYFVVIDEDYLLLDDAVVTLNGVQNPQNDYYFNNISPGKYSYKVSKVGYKSVSGNVTVTNDDVHENVYLFKDIPQVK